MRRLGTHPLRDENAHARAARISDVTGDSGSDPTNGGEGDDRPEGGLPASTERADREGPARTRPTISADGAYVLLWSVIALAAAGFSFDGSLGPVAALAGVAGVLGTYAAARDLLGGRPPASLDYLWIGTPALVAAGVAALDGRFLAAGGLGAVALAMLVEGYGWFGAGEDDEGSGDEESEGGGNEDGGVNGDEDGAVEGGSPDESEKG